MNQSQRWTSQWGKYRTQAEIVTELRELERRRHVAGWRRNLLVLGLLLMTLAMYLWLR
jgi:hypothetical protein